MQIAMEVGEAKTNIANLESTVKAAQKKQEEAKAEAKKLEKDMAEFSNNKEGKIDELKVRVPQCALLYGLPEMLI